MIAAFGTCRSQRVPHAGFHQIGFYAFAELVKDRHASLRERVPLFGRLAIPMLRLNQIPSEANASGLQILGQVVLRFGVSLEGAFQQALAERLLRCGFLRKSCGSQQEGCKDQAH